MLSSRTLLLNLLTAGTLAFVAVARAQTAAVPLLMKVPSVPGATVVERMPKTVVVGGSVSLLPGDRAGFDAFVNDVSNPKSAAYHRFLSPSQVGARFGASVDTVNKVSAYLKSAGLTVTLVADNRMAILFKGNADKVEKAFGTQIYRYKTAARTDGGPLKFFANNSAPKLPKAIAGQVSYVGGLQNAFGPVKASTLSPTELRNVYDVANLYTTKGRRGTGVNIGITNYDGYRLSNLPLFFKQFGVPGSANVTKVAVAGDGETYTAAGEGDLDLQCTFAMAPGSHVYMYDGKALDDTSFVFADAVALLAREANDNIVDIVTESYGFSTGFDQAAIEALHVQHLAMTAQGITYLCCSGDTGTYWLGYPDIDPDVLVVGGSVVTSDGTGGRQTEDGWNGSGAGYKNDAFSFNVRPSYQVGDTVPTNVNRRLFPDLTLHATGSNDYDPRDPRATAGGSFVGGYYLIYNGQTTTASGTSASCPTLAGQLALVLEELTSSGVADVAPNGRFRLGRINDLIYSLNGDSNVFVDILTGDAGPLQLGGQAVGKKGWDYVTGWGAPIIGGLQTAIAQNGVTVETASALDVSIFKQNAPKLTLGTSPSGSVADLSAANDGTAFSVQSVRQNGLGQVAAITVDVPLLRPNRRSATIQVAMNSPETTTGYVYLYNYTTGTYDLQRTMTGNGSTSLVNVVLPLDASGSSPYIQNPTSAAGNVGVLVRAIKPARLGNIPFRLNVDEVVGLERVPRSG